ncbi:hypothetical protein A678_03884 [Salmonella enterica subsp. enterica serovar Enteritidis str. 2010K-0271]|nr:hypothetical protein A678_03884 [Salmonella enterica subsp. enterica serovar Enteritidis str. 2010K-0271]
MFFMHCLHGISFIGCIQKCRSRGNSFSPIAGVGQGCPAECALSDWIIFSCISL